MRERWDEKDGKFKFIDTLKKNLGVPSNNSKVDATLTTLLDEGAHPIFFNWKMNDK